MPQAQQPTVAALVATGVERLRRTADGARRARRPADDVARLNDRIGEPRVARALGVEAAELAQSALPAAHSARTDSLALRGAQSVRAGDYDAGEADLREAQAQLVQAGRSGAPLIAVLDSLAVARMDRNDHEQALELERAALAERIRTYGEAAPELAAGYNNLGYGLVGAGRFDEAADAYQRSYELDQKYRDPGTEGALGTLSNWGWALARAGRIAPARELLAQADEGFAQLGGQVRFLQVLNSQKRCRLDAAFGTPVEAGAACERMLAATRAYTGGSGMFWGYALQLEAAHRIETGELAQAQAQVAAALEQHPESPEHARGRGGALQLRATLAWLTATPSRPGATQAAAALFADIGDAEIALLVLQALELRACEALADAACETELATQFAARLAAQAGNDDPRLLGPRLWWATRGRAGRGRRAATIDAAIASAARQLDPTPDACHGCRVASAGRGARRRLRGGHRRRGRRRSGSRRGRPRRLSVAAGRDGHVRAQGGLFRLNGRRDAAAAQFSRTAFLGPAFLARVRGSRDGCRSCFQDRAGLGAGHRRARAHGARRHLHGRQRLHPRHDPGGDQRGGRQSRDRHHPGVAQPRLHRAGAGGEYRRIPGDRRRLCHLRPGRARRYPDRDRRRRGRRRAGPAPDHDRRGQRALSRLRLVGGDVAGDGEGGGIRYTGSLTSVLELERCEVIGNSAAYGGGIYAVGNGSRGRLVLRFGNLVSGNTARVSGGGIYVENANLDMNEPENLVAFNNAAAYGGGIRALGPSVVTLRSGGRGNLGTIYANTAGYGGGIALQGSQTTTGDADLLVQTVNAAAPVRLIANTASERGGALYARGDYDEGSDSRWTSKAPASRATMPPREPPPTWTTTGMATSSARRCTCDRRRRVLPARPAIA